MIFPVFAGGVTYQTSPENVCVCVCVLVFACGSCRRLDGSSWRR
jgi:hypothetical protein